MVSTNIFYNKIHTYHLFTQNTQNCTYRIMIGFHSYYRIISEMVYQNGNTISVNKWDIEKWIEFKSILTLKETGINGLFDIVVFTCL